jgi:hypothetical protein
MTMIDWHGGPSQVRIVLMNEIMLSPGAMKANHSAPARSTACAHLMS